MLSGKRYREPDNLALKIAVQLYALGFTRIKSKRLSHRGPVSSKATHNGVGTSTVAQRTYPDDVKTSCGASSEGVLLRNKPVPNSTKFIGELFHG